MKDFLKNLVIALIGAAILAGLIFYWSNLRGVWPAVKKPPQDIAELIEGQKKPAENRTGMPLVLPDGFSIEIFARDLLGARVVLPDSLGNFWVSQTREGKISLLEISDGRVKNQIVIFEGLRKPHGLAFGPKSPFTFYIAEEHRISKVGVYSEGSLEKIADLPIQGGGHFTRTLRFGPDDRLYVSIGSSCNVCFENDRRRAAIYSLKPDGSDFKLFSKGLRNTVFFVFSSFDGKIWATDMGRDYLGDDLPPDEINVIEEDKDYGWPNCYGKNVPDPFSPNCHDKTPSHIDIPAHSAPLGLAFVPKGFGPPDWENDLIIAFHGSWNRSVPTGYKLVRAKLDDLGNFEGFEDFITGWLQGNTALGRPVDVVFHQGDLYVSDDKAGVIYKIQYMN